MPQAGYTKRRTFWTPAEIEAKAREWADLHGAPPTAADWNPSDARAGARRSIKRAQAWLGRVARFEAGEWPWTGTVWKLYGSWNAMIEAAGLPARDAHVPLALDAAPPTMEFIRTMLDEVDKADTVEHRKAALYEIAEAAIHLAGVLDEAHDVS